MCRYIFAVDYTCNRLFCCHLGHPIRDTILELLWAEGSPDNLNNNESCVVMTREGLLDDRPCDDIYPFVCKVFGNETAYSEDCYSYDLGMKNLHLSLTQQTAKQFL